MDAPSYEELIAYAAGNLPNARASMVTAALRADPEAAAVVQAWRQAQQLLASDDGVEASASALARAKAIFISRAAPSGAIGGLTGWIDAIDRFVARLVYDSRLQPAAVRFSGAVDRIVLTFETDQGEIDLQAERLAGDVDWRLMGQVAETSDNAQRDVVLKPIGAASVSAQTRSDARGGFSLRAPAGEYELFIRRGERAIVISPLSLD